MTQQSYEADAHAAQMAILRQLLVAGDSSFSQLVAVTGLSSDHANFHVKKLLAAALLERIPKEYGKYRLTRRGKEYANRMDTDDLTIEKQPKVVVDIGIEDASGRFIFQERRKQPYAGYWGFPTGKMRWGETILEAAARELHEETGLTADLRMIGTHHKLDYDENGELLEDKILFLVHGVNPRGTLLAETETHTNQWLHPAEYAKLEKRFGDIDETLRYIRAEQPFLTETRYEYKSDAY